MAEMVHKVAIVAALLLVILVLAKALQRENLETLLVLYMLVVAVQDPLWDNQELTAGLAAVAVELVVVSILQIITLVQELPTLAVEAAAEAVVIIATVMI